MQKPFDRVWARAIGWFDANELAIERIDESTGYIEGKLPAATDSPFMDCGTQVATRNIVSQPNFTKRFGAYAGERPRCAQHVGDGLYDRHLSPFGV